MSEAIVKTNLKGLKDNIKESKYALAPLHEALANSFEAILQKQNFAKGEKPEITITFEFTGLIEDAKTLGQTVVQDNGKNRTIRLKWCRPPLESRPSWADQIRL